MLTKMVLYTFEQSVEWYRKPELVWCEFRTHDPDTGQVVSRIRPCFRTDYVIMWNSEEGLMLFQDGRRMTRGWRGLCRDNDRKPAITTAMKAGIEFDLPLEVLSILPTGLFV